MGLLCCFCLCFRNCYFPVWWHSQDDKLSSFSNGAIDFRLLSDASVIRDRDTKSFMPLFRKSVLHITPFHMLHKWETKSEFQMQHSYPTNWPIGKTCWIPCNICNSVIDRSSSKYGPVMSSLHGVGFLGFWFGLCAGGSIRLGSIIVVGCRHRWCGCDRWSCVWWWWW